MYLLNLVEKKEYIKSKNRKYLKILKSGNIVSVNFSSNLSKKLQNFTGIIIKIKKRGVNFSFLVKKNLKGISIEKNFKLFSPLIKSIDLKFKGKFKKSKLYFLRKIKSKSLSFKKN